MYHKLPRLSSSQFAREEPNVTLGGRKKSVERDHHHIDTSLFTARA